MNSLFRQNRWFPVVLLIISCCHVLTGQKSGYDLIDMKDLKNHMYYLASDELSGRATTDSTIHIAARYIAGELKKLGIQAIDDDKDYYQMYTLIKKEYDQKNTIITVGEGDQNLPVNN